MDDYIDTHLKDKAGKPIHVDDIIHIQLGSYAKSKGAGPTRARVIQFGKHFDLVPEESVSNPYGGLRFTERIAQLSVVVDCRHRIQ